MNDTAGKGTGTGLEIAVIGMACRFPAARNIKEFWENLKNGVESISFFKRQELEEVGKEPRSISDPDYVKASGYLEDADVFDPAFFGYTPLEARVMDPQLRIFHECVWEALEDAGCNPETFAGPIGVYSGAVPNPGWAMEALRQSKTPSQHFDAYNLNSNSSFGTMISYNLNLQGPSFSVQTACSTSLVAIHLACQGLLNAECDVALAGGVSVNPWGKAGYLYQEGMINSPDGHCRVFDARAKGTVRGEGVGVVVLKRLEEAVEEGDHIYAVIKGSAVNNDGVRKVGYTAPSVDGQADVIRAALEAAEVEPESISYIETHGTGTTLGDPVEMEGLKLVFNTNKRNGCALASVKSNIGHLDTAAGVAGFIKAVLAVKQRMIPPSLHFESLNPEIDLANSPFYVNTQLKEWHTHTHPLRAGVSSFGIGGTNAHVILEEWQDDHSSNAERRAQSAEQRVSSADPVGANLVFARDAPQLILLSARTRATLERMTQNLKDVLSNHPPMNLADVAYTLQTGRKTFKYRGITICSTIKEAVEKLSPNGPGTLQIFSSMGKDRPVIFMFPGQGSQYVDMGRGLYQKEPLFRQAMDRCFAILKPIMGVDLKAVLYPHPPGGEGKSVTDVNQTEISQPVIFMFEYALAKLLLAWGLHPRAMIGHSIGEYTAACLCGVFSLEDALALVALRGKLMQQMPSGDMLSIAVSEDKLMPLLNEELSLAAVNGTANCVVSGTRESVEIFARMLKEKGFESRLLHTSHAFHSKMMDPVVDEFASGIKKISFNKPQKPFISNVSGEWIRAQEAVDSGYWAAHLRETVRFSDGLRVLLEEEENAVLVEVGPGKVLSTLARQHPHKKPSHSILNLIRHPKEEAADDRFLLEKIGQLWQRGVRLDWTCLHGGEKRLRVPLPTYPFEHQSFAVNRDFRDDSIPDEAPQKPGKRPDIHTWFYVPSWKGVPLPTYQKIKMSRQEGWLVVSDECGLGSGLVERLRKERQRVITVKRGAAFEQEGETDFTLNPQQENDYDTLFEILKSQGLLPDRIVHLWNVTRETAASPLTQLDRLLESGFYSLLHIVRAASRQKINRPFRLEVVSSNVYRVVGSETLCPVKAVLLGPVKVLPLEYADVTCRSIDIRFSRSDNMQHLIDDLLLELNTDTSEPVVALRSRCRWVQDFEPIFFDKTENNNPRIKQKGVYLVTGGLGGMGLVLAEELARKWQARLVLTDKSDFPAADDWDNWLDKHKDVPNDPVSLKILHLRQLEKAGAEILVCSADAADTDQMQAVIERAEKRFTTINGVIHAAGLADGGLVQVRTRQQSEAVLSPKVKGTLVLHNLLKSKRLDFFLLCSSISSVLAPPGQVAYCAANSFLDAFAFYKTTEDSTFTLSINWDTWQEVGMAVSAVEKFAGARTVSHPLLDLCIKEQSDRSVYISRFNAERLWVLDGHRILGKATLPGTAYLEIIGAAFVDQTGSQRFEISDLLLLTPLSLNEDEQKTVHTVLEKEGEVFTFSIRSKPAGAGDSWQEHARGRIAALNDKEIGTAPLDLQEITARCDTPGINRPAEGSGDYQEYLKVGPRWNNLVWQKFAAGEGLAEVQLPGDFVPDLDTYNLHPALVDTATAFLVGSYSLKEPILPFLFKKVRVTGTLPGKIFSYSRAKGHPVKQDSSKKNLAFDVTITDEQGMPVVEIEEFTLVKVSPGTAEQRAVFEKEYKDPLQDGIKPAEGVEVFNRLLSGSPPQVMVSTSDLSQRFRFRQREMKETGMEALPGDRPAEPVHPRPEISSDYAAPVNQTQQKLAEIWQQFLGIGDIGILDDFFELGGDSLKGLTVISEIHKVFNVELSITDFFTTPTIQGLAETIDSGMESIYASIAPVEDREYYPLSSAQKRLYFLQQLQPESVFYNIPNILVIEGRLDKTRLLAFENSFRILVNRQESLRTSFHLIDGQPVQRIHDSRDIEFEIKYSDMQSPLNGQEWSEAPSPGGRAEGQDGLELEMHIIDRFVRPFDITRPPLVRVEVVKIREDRHMWLFDIHHIISDASGLAILHKHLFKLYNGENLPFLKIQYRDFSHWQHESFVSGKIKKQQDYWLRVFSDGGAKLQLPTDFPRPEVMSFAGEMHLFKLPKEETLRFLEVGSAVGATLFMNLMAILNVLLFKYSGSSDIVIGSSIAGRPHADLRDIVGMFVNLLAVRNLPQPDLDYIDFLKKVKATTLEAFENQDMQFEMLIEELNLAGDTSRNPLFDITINVQNYEQPTFEVTGLSFSHGGFQYKNAKFDMLLWANQVEDELHFMLEYSTELFKPETAQDFSTHLKEIMDQVGRNREIKLKDINLSYRVVKPTVKAPEIDFDFGKE